MLKWPATPALIGSARLPTRPKHAGPPPAAGRRRRPPDDELSSGPNRRIKRVNEKTSRSVNDGREALVESTSPSPLRRVEWRRWPERSRALWEVGLFFNMKEKRRNKAHATRWAGLKLLQVFVCFSLSEHNSFFFRKVTIFLNAFVQNVELCGIFC